MSNHQTLVLGIRHFNPSFHGWLFQILFLFIIILYWFCIDIQVVVISLKNFISLNYGF